MTEEDKEWLRETFPQYKQAVLRGVNLDAYAKAEVIMIGKSSKPNCSCSYSSYKQKIEGYYDKWLKENI